MKFSAAILAAVCAVCLVNGAQTKVNPTIKKVVQLLETMMAKSKTDGDNDRTMWAKYLCYCNDQKETKTKEIDDLTTDISQLENQIEALQASNGQLSTEVAELKNAVAEKDMQIRQANGLQLKRVNAWNALKKDLTDSIASMKDAIKVLAAVGADQTLEEGTHTSAMDNQKFMAGFKASSLLSSNLRSSSLLKIQSQVKQALYSAQAFMPPSKVDSVQSFLQAPFTGTYTSQSAEVMGILKNMRDTFKANYVTSETQFNAETKAHNALVKELTGAKTAMEKLQKKKEGELGVNDGDLATARGSLDAANKSKQSKVDFLEEMEPICKTKAKEYEERNMMRANEDAAIAEAIAILNRDSAFAAFNKVDATDDFLQLSSAKDTRPRSQAKQAEQMLLQAASVSGGAIGLARIAALIEANNPFEVVLEEIKKMIALIDTEQKTDKETLDWCNKERSDAAGVIRKKVAQIIALNSKINALTTTIEHPSTGLKALIDTTEKSLDTNYNDQKTETADRVEANQLYQQTIANEVEAEELLTSAIKVLTDYYAQISFVQAPGTVHGAEGAVRQGPWSDATTGKSEAYDGQSTNGNSAITMLQFLLKQTETEEAATHKAEQGDQHDFEDSMALLKKAEKQMQDSLAALRLSLAKAEKDLADAQGDLKKTEAEKAAVEFYLVQIKPGCDFITDNFQLRTDHRVAEKGALQGASGKLKGSAAYTTFTNEQRLEDLGTCKDICESDGRLHANCEACLADVTVPGYCADHASTAGCSTLYDSTTAAPTM